MKWESRVVLTSELVLGHVAAGIRAVDLVVVVDMVLAVLFSLKWDTFSNSYYRYWINEF